MAEKFSAVLRHRSQRIWQAIERHPFLRELQAGTLPMDRFAYFELFARHALGAVEVERSFHANFGKTLGLSREQLDRVRKGPITQAYIGHLQSVARSGSLSEIVAAVLPCYWIYGEAGRRLQKGAPSKPKIYREWIETYASEDFWKPVREQIQLMDALGGATKPGEKKLLLDHFILSSRYEFMFWEQAYRLEQWPI
jgi:thiaminase/transcriptional activator TenA